MKWIDVSLTLSEDLPAWPSDDPFRYEETGTIAAGGESNCARMSLSVHFGTHVDAPYHFIPGGATIDQIDPELFLGPSLLVAVPEAATTIEPAHLEGAVPAGTRRLLVKTRNSAFVGDRVFHTDFVAFSEAGIRFLLDRGVRLLGLDYFSIAPYGAARPPHVAFLGAGGVAIESLDLGPVEPGPYELCCLPLKIRGSGGAPARVVLGRPD
jgi:arylformamidase